MRFGSRVRHPAAALHLGGLLRSKSGLIYLLRDLFTTDEAAPLTSPRTCEPGPGTGAIVDTGNTLSISNSKLITDATGTAIDPYVDIDNGGAFFPLDAGLAAFCKLIITNTTTAQYSYFSFDTSGSAANPSDPFFYMRMADIQIKNGPATPVSYAVSIGQIPKLLIVVRSVSAGFHVIDRGKLYWVFDEVDFIHTTGVVGLRLKPWTSLAEFDEMALIDLPANGYTAWDADFSTVTDSKTAPVTATLFDCEADCHLTCTFTYEALKSVSNYIRFTDNNNYLWISATTGAALQLYKMVGGSLTNIVSVNGLFSDGVSYQIDIVANGSSVRVYLDNILKIDETVTEHLAVAGGRIIHSLATNDIVLSTHPYPALGIATDRVICPQAAHEGTHDDDFLCYIRNVQLDPTFTGAVLLRYTATSDLRLYVYPTGQIVLSEIKPSGNVTRITAAAGSITDGDDLCLVVEGASAQIFVNGVSVGSTTAISEVLTGTAWKTGTTWVPTQAFAADSIEFFPRDVTSLLPSELV